MCDLYRAAFRKTSLFYQVSPLRGGAQSQATGLVDVGHSVHHHALGSLLPDPQHPPCRPRPDLQGKELTDRSWEEQDRCFLQFNPILLQYATDLDGVRDSFTTIPAEMVGSLPTLKWPVRPLGLPADHCLEIPHPPSPPTGGSDAVWHHLAFCGVVARMRRHQLQKG